MFVFILFGWLNMAVLLESYRTVKVVELI